MERTLPTVDSKPRPLIALGGSIAMASLLFVLVPFTQKISFQKERVIEFREAVTITPPAVKAPPESVEEVQETEPPPKPEFQEDFSELNLNQLEMSLNPGIGDALAMGISTQSFQTEVDTVGDIQQIFTFADLPQAPRIVNRPNIQFPRELARRGITEGKVIALIEIQPNGRAKILKIVSMTHPLLEKTAREVIRQARFTKPEVNGVATSVQGEWPIVLKQPK